jgi:hypothetical protein
MFAKAMHLCYYVHLSTYVGEDRTVCAVATYLDNDRVRLCGGARRAFQ